MDHKSKNSHHSSTSLVQLNSTLLELGLLVAPLRKSPANPLSSNIFHDENLNETTEGNNLSQSSSGDGVGSVNSGPSVGEGVEGVSSVVNVSGKVESGTGDDVTQEGELGDTSMLDLDVTETVGRLLVGVIEESEHRSSGGRLRGPS